MEAPSFATIVDIHDEGATEGFVQEDLSKRMRTLLNLELPELQEEMKQSGPHTMTEELESMKDLEDWTRTELPLLLGRMVTFQMSKAMEIWM